MGVSKSFQAFLLLLLLAGLGASYFQGNNALQEQGQRLLSQYKQAVSQWQAWSDDGKSLHSTINTKFPLHFFQYTDAVDGSKNFTRGQLQAEAIDNQHLFRLELSDNRELTNGRLQVKLDTGAQVIAASQHYMQTAILMLALYLVTAIAFAIAMWRLKSRINYAADYLRNLMQFNFSALATSRLSGELKPLGDALEDGRTLLKRKVDALTLENEKLSKVAFQDAVTGFNTRHSFTRKLDEISKSDKTFFGMLAMVQATELANINQLLGRSAGDDYLAKIAACARKAAGKLPDAEFYRISSADFAIFLPGLVAGEADKFHEPFKALLDEYLQHIKVDSIAYTGMVPFQAGCDPIQLMALADAAVSIAQTLGPNSVQLLEKLSEEVELGDNRWRTAIDDIINRRAVRFMQQPILPCRSEVEVYRELFARFFNSEGKFMPTSTVIAMAERHGMAMELDKLVVNTVIKQLQENPNLRGNYGINISTSSVLQESFVSWLKDKLQRDRQLSARLVLELNEAGMQANIQASHKFVREMHSVGTRVSIERFGMGFTSFKFFREVRPDYIKLDGSYSEAIDQDANNKFLVRMMVDVARRLGIRVVATGVEQQVEKLALESLLIDGLQGYYIAQPQALGSEELN
ncbi:EAL domain-containing protein [Shewanella cyperi]|uniref:EAL domain-containing protein n=1 Tax=Shewanella cyperi TaxID=2814292 RepID=UPI001A948EFE|nr:GGDEF domain-containing protein [Shewanella cyperi]QSX42410.1 GGDEF domain-containing protein [Shewanella cyperi]